MGCVCFTVCVRVVDNHQQDSYYSSFSAPASFSHHCFSLCNWKKYLKFKVIWIFFCIFYWNELSAKIVCRTYKLCWQQLLVRYLVIARFLKSRNYFCPTFCLRPHKVYSACVSICVCLCVCISVWHVLRFACNKLWVMESFTAEKV